MDFLQFIISLLSSEDGLKLISWVLELISGNSSTCEQDDEKDLEIEEMFREITNQKADCPIKKENSPTVIGEGFALEPIARVAGKDVIFMLTRYFAKG